MYNNIWLKRVWIPFWVVQLIFVLILLVLMSFALYGVAYVDREDESDTYDDVYTALNAVAAVYIAVSGLTIIFDIVEIILLARRKLSPVTAVVLETILTLVWVILFVLNIVGIATARRGGAFGFIFMIIIVATSLGKLIYSSVILHRYRKNRIQSRGAYAAPGAGEAEAGFDPTPSGAYTAYNPTGAPPNPFRDPSRDASPNPTAHQHRPTGEAAGYYDSAPNGAYEMQQSVERY